MNGYRAVLRTEIRDITHTWRIVILPGFLLLTAITSPLLAKNAPKILASTLGKIGQTMPPPNFWDAYAQWTKNLTPVVLLVVIFTCSNSLGTNQANGPTALTLSTPVTRTAYVLAAFTANVLLITISMSLATLVMWTVTSALFHSAQPMPLIRASATWLLLALFYAAAAATLSILFKSPLAAAGGTMALLMGNSLLALWTDASRLSPAGLPNLISSLAQARALQGGWSLCTALGATLGLLLLSTLLMQRRDI